MTAQTMLPLEPARPPLLIKPRPYQLEAISAIEEAPARGIRRPLFVIPTGGGKTVVFAHLLARRPGRSMVLVHRDELKEQAAAKLRMIMGMGLDLGIVKAERDETDAQVVVASVQTLRVKGRAERCGRFDTIIVDEAHHAVSPMYLDVLGRLGCFEDDGPLTVGCTATADRTDNIALGHVFQEIVFKRGLMWMIGNGYLVDVHAEQIGSDFSLGNLKVRAGDYTDGSIGEELERSDALPALVEAWKKHASDRLTVGFMPTIATAQLMAEAFRGAGVPSEAVWGAMPMDGPGGRRDVLARLHRGELRVVPNCAVLTEGWDEPAVSCILMGRPTKSAPFLTQMVGRGLRPFTGMVATLAGEPEPYEKTDCLVLDVAGAADTGLATLATLAGLALPVKKGQSLAEAAEEQGDTDRKRVAFGVERSRKVELLRRAEMHWVDVDGSWVLPAGGGVVILVDAAKDEFEDAWEVWKVGAAKGSTPVRISERALTMDWARGVGEEFVRGLDRTISRSDAAWRARSVSEGQRAQLERNKIEIPKGLTRGKASDLLTAKYAARDIKRIRKIRPPARR
jgi:superfamily II DNA or RNA helicase